MSAKVSTEAVRELAARMDGTSGRTRAAIKRDFSSAYGCSASTLSRVLTDIGVRSHARADAGTRRKEVDEEVLRQIAAIQRSSLSLRKGVVMPAEDALNIAEDSGLVERGLVAPEYYNAWLRDHEASRREQMNPAPHTELRSLGPNHVHQVDFSVAVNWKVFQGRPEYEHLIYKNKLPTTGVPRLLRLILVDHATGCFAVHYTCSTGETVAALLEGLYFAWAEKSIGGESVKAAYPFRGVPQILMADRGSANQAGVTQAVVERLGVQLNICEGARSKGTVEVSHRWWEEHFESRLRLKRPENVEQLNEWATDFAVRLCALKVHSRHGAARSSMWAWHINRRPETQLRELRCSFEQFKAIALSEPAKALVHGNRVVKFRAQKYRVPEQFLPGEYVAVQYSPFAFPQILVRAADVPTAPAFLCEPVLLDEFGFATTAPIIGQQYRAQKKTGTARFVDEADRTAKEFVEAQELKVFGHHRHAIDPVDVPTAGTEVLPATEAAETFRTKVQARQEVIERVGRQLSQAEKDFLNTTFGEQVSDAEIASAVSEILTGVTARVLSFPIGAAL